MDTDTNNPAEDKQSQISAASNNQNTDNTIQGNNHKPLKTRSRKKTAQRHNRITLEKAFPKAYIEHSFNGTKALLSLKPHLKPNSANAEAPTILAKPSVQEALHELLKDNDMKVRDIVKIHKRNMIQDEDLSTSQRAVQDGYKLYGLLNTEKGNTTVNIALITKE